MQIHNRITINAIRLQSTKSNWIATRLPGDRRIAPKSRDIHKLQPTVPDCPQNPPEVPQCLHNLLQFRAIQRIGTGLQIQCNPVSTRPTGLRIATERPRASHSRPSFAIHPVQSNPGRSRHDQTRLQLDCETTKDCNVIGRIALKLYGLQVNCSNYTSHSGIEASNPSNLLQSLHTDCIPILPPVTYRQPTITNS